MLPYEIFRSQPLTWAASSTLTVPMSFLEPALRMRAPVIDRLDIRCNLTGNSSTSGFKSVAFPSVLTNILIQDAAGDRVNVRGSSLRLINQLEVPCFDGPNIAVSQTGATKDLYLTVPFAPLKSRRPQDFRLNVREIIGGGSMILTTAAAAIGSATAAQQFTVTSGTFEVYAKIYDEALYAGDVPELKSRVTYKDYSITATEYSYPVVGSLRYALWYAGQVAEYAASAWSAQKFISSSLNFPNVQDTYFNNQYFRCNPFFRVADPSGGVITEDAVQGGYCVPLVMPNPDQAISEMPSLSTLHVKSDLSSITTSNLPQLIVCAITDRSPALSARTLGLQSGDQAQGAIARFGHVNTADGNEHPVGKVGAKVLTKRLPVKPVRPGK